VTNAWYNWNVTSFVQSEFGGDNTASLLLKPVTEGSPDATAPAYGFDAREYGSNMPVLVVTTSATASSVANVKFFYRYSSDNATWGAWTQTGATDTAAPYNSAFNFPNGAGYYEFYSIATDNLGGVEATPAFAQTAVHYQAASGTAQTITFPVLSDVTVGSGYALPTASATSGLAVTLSSQTLAVCTLSGNVVTTVGVGTCTIAATQLGDPGYWQPAAVTRSFSALALTQTITFPSIANQVLGSGPVVLNATSSSGLPVSYLSQTAAVCTASGNTVTLVSAGTCTIAADQSGDATYAAAPTVTQSFQVTASGGTGSSGDVPIPAWALAALGAGLLGAMRRRSAGKKQQD
jgi:MYXO-CTERM domain-containing protein